MVFYRWRKKLNPKLDLLLVQLPGRDARSNERFATDMTTAGEQLMPHLIKQLKGKPHIIVGHSMGGLFARQSCQSLAALGLTTKHLITVASFSPDHVVSAIDYLHQQTDQQLEQTFTDFANIPASPLKQKLITTLRADLRFLSTYKNLPDNLGCDLTIFSGLNDTYVTTALTKRWRNQKGQSQLSEFDINGTHTSVINQPEVVQYVNHKAIELGLID